MRVLFLISSFQDGGAERVGAWLCSILAEAGHQVTAATLSAKDPFYELDPKVAYVRLGLTSRSRNPAAALMAATRRIRAIRALIERERPDALVSFMTAPNLYAIAASRRSGTPVIAAERNCRGADIVSPPQDALRRLLYPRAAKVVLQTQADRANYPFLRNAAVFPNPIRAVRQDGFPESRERIVLGVGRLERQKGFDLLIEAFSHCARRAGWRLLIAGEGRERSRLEGQIRSLGLEGSVELLGRRKDVFSLYARASIFALPSRYEGFPNALLEAMASGCAAVAADCPTGPREIVRDGMDGLIVPPGDSGSLARALDSLMGDDAKVKELGAAAVAVSDRFSEERIAGLWLELIEGISGKR